MKQEQEFKYYLSLKEKQEAIDEIMNTDFIEENVEKLRVIIKKYQNAEKMLQNCK